MLFVSVLLLTSYFFTNISVTFFGLQRRIEKKNTENVTRNESGMKLVKRSTNTFFGISYRKKLQRSNRENYINYSSVIMKIGYEIMGCIILDRDLLDSPCIAIDCPTGRLRHVTLFPSFAFQSFFCFVGCGNNQTISVLPVLAACTQCKCVLCCVHFAINFQQLNLYAFKSNKIFNGTMGLIQ